MGGGKVKKLNILYEDNHLIVVEKPSGILAQADSSPIEDMLTILKAYLKEKYHKPGNVYLGLVHRLDKPVGGLMVFAKTSKAASRLSEQIRTHQLRKTYIAIVEGLLAPRGVFEDYLKKANYKGVVCSMKDGKLARLSYEVKQTKNNHSLVEIQLETGRYHQIRVQFAHRGHPLLGDTKYGTSGKYPIALLASGLSFIHPVTREQLTFHLPLPKRDYWTEFTS